MPTCLITGSSGLIGSTLVPRLLEQGFHLYLLRRSLEDRPSHPNCEVICVDLSRPNFVDNLPQQIDYVIHLAQSDRFRDFPQGVDDVFNVNVAACVKLLDYARKAKVRNFVLASSGIVYGQRSSPFCEDDELVLSQQQLGFYFASKLSAELCAESYAKEFNVIILRFFFAYGMGQKESMLIPRLVDNVLQGKPIQLQGSEGISINPTHVSDAARAIERSLILQSTEKINVAGPEVLTLRSIGNIIGNVVGREPLFNVDPNAEPSHVVGNIEKMKRLLGAPKVQFQDGIVDYIQNVITVA